jgi:hypothetical protein
VNDKGRNGLFDLIDGLRPVDPRALEEYERGMAEEAIPEIIRALENRQRLAAESRQRRLEQPL